MLIHLNRLPTRIGELVKQDAIRMHVEPQGISYYANTSAAHALHTMNLHAFPPRARTDRMGNDFGDHIHQLKMEGPHGLLAALGNIDTVTTAFNGAHVVPYTAHTVDKHVAALGARTARSHSR